MLVALIYNKHSVTRGDYKHLGRLVADAHDSARNARCPFAQARYKYALLLLFDAAKFEFK